VSLAPSAKLSKSAIKVADVAMYTLTPQVTLVGIAKGFYKEAGFENVDYTYVGPGTTQLQALVGGSLDFSVDLNLDTVARANSEGEKVYQIAGLVNVMDYVLLGAKDIKTVQDLKGKKVCTDAPGGSADHLTRDMLKAEGIEPDRDVTMVPIQGASTDRINSVLGGATQATIAGLIQSVDYEGQLNRLVDASKAYPQWERSGLATRGELLDKNPDTVVAYLKGALRTIQFIMQPGSETEIAQIMRDAGYKINDSTWPKQMEIVRSEFPANGEPNVPGVQAMIKIEQAAGRLPSDYTPEKLMRLDPLKQAQKELGIS
jgi:NitT/TauT family transport system substrate-binding protein